MKRATIAAITAIAMAVPYFATAQGDAKASVTAKLRGAVDTLGAPKPNPCVVADAADYGQVQEAACEGGLGYMIFNTAKGAQPEACAALSAEVDDKGQLLAACRLPANKDAFAVVDTVLKATSTACNPVAKSFFGDSDTGSSAFFEVVCDDAKGYLVQVWKDPADVKQFGNKAWVCDANFKSRGNDCELTKLGLAGAKAAEAKRLALLNDYYNPKAGAPAPAAAAPRAAASAAAAAAPVGPTFSGALPAALTKAIGDSGFNCPYNPAKVLEDTADHTILEFRCNNKDDGRVGILNKKAGVAPSVWDCASVQVNGFKCNDTEEKGGYAAMSTAIKRMSSGSFGGDCTVSAMRVIGASAKSGTIEVKCTDPRIGGEVLTYTMATGKLADVISCANFAAAPGQSLRCMLPGAAR